MDYFDDKYLAYDCLHEFQISDIGHGFSRIGKDKNIRISMKNVITKALKQSVLNGNLISTLQINDESPDNQPIDWQAIRIQRNELEKWFESRDQNPPFLYSEARNQKGGSKPRHSQIAKAVCQGIARTLWKANPDMTIADMLKREEILEYGEAKHYQGKTVHAWLSPVDPRPTDKKTGRPQKR
jgi:hypothetical protein